MMKTQNQFFFVVFDEHSANGVNSNDDYVVVIHFSFSLV